MAKGTIIKILPKHFSRNGGQYTRVFFRLEDGFTATTDLVDSYRNVARWKNLLRVGIDLDGLILKGKNKVNADSFPREIKAGVRQEYKQMPDGSMAIIEVMFEEPKPLEELEKPLIQDKLNF